MSIERIKNLPVASLVDKDAVLFLWTTNKYIEEAFDIARKWGFNFSTMLVWCKSPKGRGLGGTFGISTEFLLFCRRGSLKSKDRHWSTWFEAERRDHSEKPEVVIDIIDKCFDGSKLELFSRRKRMGWDVWGNEVYKDVELNI
jgi:N6-adenosine-specific RNA methylase IME4